MMTISTVWFEIVSELFVNLSAGWFAVVFIEPQLGTLKTPWELLFRFFLGIISLFIAKSLREEVQGQS
ncbi:MAG: hypothetical protein AAB557_02590 [Patescibacteria group bacterium]